MLHHWKDILIGLLVAYIVIDLLLAYATKSRHPGLFRGLENAVKDESYGIVLVIGVGAGFLAYYLARKSRDLFSIKKSDL